MGVSVGDLEQRQLERLRGELAEMLTANLAYPPFFNYRSGTAIARPPGLNRLRKPARTGPCRSIGTS